MIRGIHCAAALALLAACGDLGGSGEKVVAGERIPCALAGAPQLRSVCTVERLAGRDGLILIVRSPNGGFRRLLVTGGGHDIRAADGAEQASTRRVAGIRMEVALAGDRFILPAAPPSQ